MKRKTLARALAMALCLMLCVPAMATSWDWTAGSQTAASDAPASAQYAGDEERYRRGEGAKPRFEKPWPTFTEDLEAVADRLLVAHHTPDNMPKQSRKRLRIRGRIRTGRNGETLYAQGDTARGALHQQTFYGAIERQGEVRYVVRKPLGQLQPSDVGNIVVDAVRQKVKEAIDAVGF